MLVAFCTGVVLLVACDDPPVAPPSADDECDRNGGNLFPFPMHHENPAWSRQGLIAYEDRGIVEVHGTGAFEIDPNLAGIWILDPQTGQKTRLISPGTNPHWSPDGSRIVFDAGHLFVVDVDGGDPQQLTWDGRNAFPSWSPDGGWIAYDSDLTVSNRTIWIVRADGTQHTEVGGGIGARMPTWHPDGQTLAFIHYVVGLLPSAELHVMSSRGDHIQRVSHNLTDDTFPEFSPDGGWIAYGGQVVHGDGLPQVFVIGGDGSGAHQLTTEGGYHPSWSPDGRKIVFTRYNSRCNTARNGVLWIVDVKTGEQVQLTTKWSRRH
jgi:Tol biopolymer transport system component